jgi:sugar lactone lactonase YvrE
MRRVAIACGLLMVAVTSQSGKPLLMAPVEVYAQKADRFPDLIRLPEGFGPEGIAVGNGHTFFVGAVAGRLGEILTGDLRTGEVTQLVAPTGRPVTGMKFDSRSKLLFVSGAGSGRGTVYDTASGAEVVFFQFQTGGTFINDVVVTREAAYFTDTTRALLYRVALDERGVPSDGFTIIPLPMGPTTCGGTGRTNGIVADPSGKHLIVVHSSEGQLYLVDTGTLSATPIDLGGERVCNGDGLLLDGKTLYVVQNQLNRVAVVQLTPDFFSGTIERFITEPFTSNPATKVPTTIAEFGNSLYAVTAGFAAPTPDYVVRLQK